MSDQEHHLAQLQQMRAMCIQANGGKTRLARIDALIRRWGGTPEEVPEFPKPEPLDYIVPHPQASKADDATTKGRNTRGRHSQERK